MVGAGTNAVRSFTSDVSIVADDDGRADEERVVDDEERVNKAEEVADEEDRVTDGERPDDTGIIV